MLRMWLNQYISSDNLESMVSTWTLTPCSTDYAMAIRLCKEFGVVETDTLQNIHTKVMEGLSQLIDKLNQSYNVSTSSLCDTLYTLSLWVPYEEVYAIVTGVDGAHKATLRIEVDITNLLYVDLDLVSR